MPVHEEKQTLLTWDFEYAFKFKKIQGNFAKLWEMKASARESLKDWLCVAEISPKVAEVCANACSELIENCIKYTREGESAAASIRVVDTTIIVDTVNVAESTNSALLQASLDALKAASDPKQIFVQKLLNPEEGVSHLGLIKIVMETKGTLELVPEKRDDVVHVKLQMTAG